MPSVLLQAHSSSLGSVFYTGTQFPKEYRGSLFVAAHGSWNRKSPTGSKVIRLVFDGKGNAAFPKGKTMHLNVSAISVLGASPLWEGASFIGELAYNRRLAISDNASQLDPLATKEFVWADELVQGKGYGNGSTHVTLVQPYLGAKFDLGRGFKLSGLLSQRWRDGNFRR